MIEFGEIVLDLSDPLTLALSVAGCLLLLMVILIIFALRAASRSARMVEPMARQLGSVNHFLQHLQHGQSQLSGGLETVSQSQQMQMQTMEMRLAEVQRQMAERLHDSALKSARTISDLQEKLNESLHGSSEKTTKTLTELQAKLETIDKAQTNIEKLSGDVLSLQDILSNKQARGAFGEIQLNDIVSKALPANSYSFQTSLSNGRRVDCLIDLPNPPGPIAIDAKFPLEPYEALVAAESKEARARALQVFKQAVRAHIKAISDRYLIEGETADGALMFVPSEAVYAELHARLPEVVREGFEARVWIVSPTTCMATLNTMRAILKDARMKEQAGEIRKALKQLHRDVELIGTRADKLETHLRQASEDVSGILVASQRASKRADRLDNFEFEDMAADDTKILPLDTKGRTGG